MRDFFLSEIRSRAIGHFFSVAESGCLPGEYFRTEEVVIVVEQRFSKLDCSIFIEREKSIHVTESLI